MTDLSYIDRVAMSDDQMIRQIGEFVQYHRIEQNKTQEMLAKEAGISRSTLSSLEKGGTVTIATLIQVLRVLDQLQVMDGFTIVRRQSPLLLAQEEKKKRQRATASPKGKPAAEDDLNW